MNFKKSFIYLMLIICGLTMIIPFLWMVTTAVKSQLEVNKGNLGFMPYEKYPVIQLSDGEHRVKIIKTENDRTVTEKKGRLSFLC